MIVLGWLQALGLVNPLLKVLKPLMRILGLPDRTAMMFMAGVLFGVVYGSAVIVEEAKQGTFKKEELEYLHISIGINHAIIEDAVLFVVLGLNVFWMGVPKFTMAIVAVQAYRALVYLRNRIFHRTTAGKAE